MPGFSNSPQETTILRLEARKSFALNLLLHDEDDVPIDITGATFSFTRQTVLIATPLTVGDTLVVAGEVIDAEGGHASVLLQASDLDSAPGDYPFSITMTTVNGYSVVLAKGEIQLKQNTEFASTGSSYVSGAPGDTLDIELQEQQVINLELGRALPGRDGSDGNPVGTVLMFAGAVAPDATYLVCDGSLHSRAAFPELFAVIGEVYGAGDGSTTFAVPDARDKFIVSTGPTYALADTGGEAMVTLTTNELPSHAHSGTIDAGGAHTPTVTAAAGGDHAHTTSTAAAGTHDHGATTGSGGSHSHTASTGTDGSHAHGGLQQGSIDPLQLVQTGATDGGTANRYHIRDGVSGDVMGTSSGGIHSHSVTVNSGGSHSHSISGDGSHTHTVTVNSGGSHTHVLTAVPVAAHTHTFSGGSVGSDQAHENRPPYLALLYIIKAA